MSDLSLKLYKVFRKVEIIKKNTEHPVISALIVIGILALIWIIFGIDLSRFNLG